jgi:branched-chain amino acid transport system permease protein
VSNATKLQIASERKSESRFADAVSENRYKIVGFALLAVILVAYPFLASSRWIDAMNLVFLSGLGAIALNILLGVAGQLSLGSSAFIGIGSFMVAVFATQVLQLPFLATLALGAIAGGIAAVVLGIIALRIRGFYLVLATIALHYIVYFIAQRYQDSTVGLAGFRIPTAELFGFNILRSANWYWVLLVILVLVTIGAYNLLKSKTGRAFRAIKDRDIAAAILGVDVTRTKLVAFILTSMLIGFQGALFAYYLGVVTYESITLDVTVQYVAMIVIGGLASIGGSLIGALFVVMLPVVVQALLPLLPSWFPFAQQISTNVFAVQLILYGLAIVIFMRVAPRGLAHSLKQLGRWLVSKVSGTSTRNAGRKAGA